MVAINKENQAKTGTVKDVVCPKCWKLLQYPRIVNKGRDRYDRTIRTYFGWCFECDTGFKVIQFGKEDRWFICKYKPYQSTDKGQDCKPAGQ